MEREEAPPSTPSDEGSAGTLRTVVGGLLVAVCSVVAIAVLLSWIGSLLFGTGLGFWPAIGLAVVVTVGIVLVAR